VVFARLSSTRTRFVDWWVALNALQSDAILYGASALFALGLGWTSSQAAQWHWGYLAAPAYAAVALAAFVLGRRRLRRAHVVRMGLLALVVAGSVALPLSLEAKWRQAQPEVSVIDRSAQYVTHGLNPYRTYWHDGHLVDVVPGMPAWESFFPYFPLMSVFGLPSAASRGGGALSDARIVMSLMTLLVSGLALALLRAPRDKKVRVAQVILALPTGALFLSTGGDDMPILALTLLGVAALQRRSNYVAGVSLGLAAAMKLTAWPMAAGALLVARTRQDRTQWRTVAAVMSLIVLVSIAPFAWRAPRAFMTNVFAFPLGLAGVRSPAASPLPGHILTTAWPFLGHVLAPIALLIGGYFGARYVQRHRPLSLARLLGLMSAAFAVMIMVASATRIGYLIYPLNFALWAWVCAEAPVKVLEPA
jgi:Glycosyltransferase family 87